MRERGRVLVYVLMLATGLALGIVAGGEFIRRVYGVHPQQQNSSSAQQLSPDSAGPADTDAASMQQQVLISRETALVRATRVVSPCVVSVVVTQIQVVQSRYYYNDFFDFFVPRIRQVENLGSGVVIRNDGMILTNYHVVQGARTVFVNFPDGRRMDATIVGTDEQTDLAVLSVGQKDSFQAIRMADSDKLMIGEWVLAIGNPFLDFINDVHPTVTVGVVSALGRSFSSPEGAQYRGMIQTDAAINPGNSGGPLVDALGRAIGINTVIYTGKDAGKGWVGMGFAIPINRARRVADELIKFGRRRSVWTGLQAQDLTRDIALALGYERAEGVVIVGVQAGGPGERVGLRRGDIITRIGDLRIHSRADLDGAFIDLFVNDRVVLTYRRNGVESRATMLLEEYPRGR